MPTRFSIEMEHSQYQSTSTTLIMLSIFIVHITRKVHVTVRLRITHTSKCVVTFPKKNGSGIGLWCIALADAVRVLTTRNALSLPVFTTVPLSPFRSLFIFIIPFRPQRVHTLSRHYRSCCNFVSRVGGGGRAPTHNTTHKYIYKLIHHTSHVFQSIMMMNIGVNTYIDT